MARFKEQEGFRDPPCTFWVAGAEEWKGGLEIKSHNDALHTSSNGRRVTSPITTNNAEKIPHIKRSLGHGKKKKWQGF